MRDLLALVADQDMVETLKALLNRNQSLGIRPIDFQVERHLGGTLAAAPMQLGDCGRIWANIAKRS